MEWIEVTGRTLEDARELALDRLGVVEDDLEYEVLEEAKGGLFGRLGRTDARIRARVKPISREKPGERRRRKRGSDRKGGSRGGSRGGGRRSGTSPKEPSNGSGATAPDEEGDSVDTAELSIEEQADAARDFAEELVRAMGLQADVAAFVDDDVVRCTIDGPELGILVGPRGATLQAVEEVLRAVVQRVTGGHSARVFVDIAGYRERRRVALAEFTTRIAEEVLTSGEAKALEPMGAPDRKVVHDTVAELDGVTTSSEGEEPRRRVVIRPA